MDDDGSGWDEVLLALWGAEVRAAVVHRIEQATIGRRGWLVRALADPAGSEPGWTETVHALVLAAIRDETGADLELLGSQAAWECYEQVWSELATRWEDGGVLSVVSLRAEPEVDALLRSLPAEAAAHAGADVRGAVPDPLWLHGRLRVDVEGLETYLRFPAGALEPTARVAIERIIACAVAAG